MYNLTNRREVAPEGYLSYIEKIPKEKLSISYWSRLKSFI